MYASLNGHKNIVEHLVSNGANVNHKDINGETPLIWAVANYAPIWMNNIKYLNHKKAYDSSVIIKSLIEKYMLKFE